MVGTVEGAQGRTMTGLRQAVAQTLAVRLLDDEDQHAVVAFEGMGDLDVDDADVELGGARRDPGQRPLLIGDRNPQLDQILGPREAGGKRDTSGACRLEDRQQRRAVTLGDDLADAGERVDEHPELCVDRCCVLGADVRPDRR